tara:strand:+ start:683 stop:913 length:231 start_codon:yes stop_codon:yes gene_type:complete
MQINKADAISSLGNWEIAIWNDDLSTIKFYSNGSEISKPTDFPSDADINARQADMQTKADTGNYNNLQALKATYSA